MMGMLGKDGREVASKATYLVCEAFSPPRATTVARVRGLHGGWALDWRVVDPITRRSWDLAKRGAIHKIKNMMRDEKIHLFVVSPPESRLLLQHAAELGLWQEKLGGAWAFVKPTSSRAWAADDVAKLVKRRAVMTEKFDMGSKGMVAYGVGGVGLIKKTSTIATNDMAVAEIVRKRCDRTRLDDEGNALAALNPTAEEPEMSRVLVDEAEISAARNGELGMGLLGTLGIAGPGEWCDPGDNVDVAVEGSSEGQVAIALLGVYQLARLEEARKAGRQLEMETFERMKVYHYSSMDAYSNNPGAVLVDTTWVEQNIGTSENPEMKCRLCAREFNDEARLDLYAATPPLIVTRALVSRAATRGRRSGCVRQLMVLDVKRAFLYGDTLRDVYIRLPVEDPRSQEPGVLGKLDKAMYGTRDAPMVWRGEVKKAMKALGFVGSTSSPCVYRHRTLDLVVCTHVDDFLACGAQKDLQWFKCGVAKVFEIKGEILGTGPGEKLEIQYLKRRIAITPDGLTYEAGSKHVPLILAEMGMEACKPVGSPGSKDETKNISIEALSKGEQKQYRRVSAMINYLAMDRPDIGFSTKEVARSMSNPDSADLVRLKRLVRYLKGRPRLVWSFPWQAETSEVRVFSDSDWAGCLKTRRSTSGGLIMHGKHLLAHWSRTQATVALSSGEAEVNAALKAGSEGLGFRTLAQEMLEPVNVTIVGDSTASRGVLLREGAGRIKHLDVKQLWLQEKVAHGDVEVVQQPRSTNLADALTHHWTSESIGHYEAMGVSW